ncbi:DUF3080 family protein [Paraglaciecola aquimarina]|uniref:DUF3080 family protein n=1 Tax=Paraglaciecola aquimarina TaxID=1235557 RepID=A0ABU3SZD1_9ALTE|nr:DUF3080 family protein [Paraglaciecola aquimarina]MDU0355374.1 DUF3080 family protein [Paraglaciecola aquimarina]
MRQNINDTNIKLFEFYQLKPCALYSLVAERNTSLGHMQLPSTRYLYERNVLIALDRCIGRISDTDLQQKLKNWHHIKQQNLPFVWSNLLQKSSEIKYALSSNRHYLSTSYEEGLSATQQALTYLTNINQNSAIDSKELEAHLQNLQQAALPAKIWLSQTLLTEHLNQSTLWLKQQNKHLKCKAGKAETKVEYMANVFMLYFIEKIQPIAGKVNHYQYQLSPIFEKWQHTPNLSVSFKDYLTQQTQIGFEEYKLAVANHIQFWQYLFKRCNIAPN